ncbi:unnamed protein product [Cuscuta campestris]|uniref:Pectinesterase inhibitor domain-containing protein n=1 Tax=Cuscuta campestris TaxID=132261 RepID=A0A484LPB6_9ASTE|nr:unnamed protein product [Cuscuta campestris]
MKTTLSINSLIIFLALSSVHSRPSRAAGAGAKEDTQFIEATCNARDVVLPNPSLCVRYLSPFAGAVKRDLAVLARVAIDVTHDKTNSVVTYMKKNVSAGADLIAVNALKDCWNTYLVSSIGEMENSTNALKAISAAGKAAALGDVQAWMDAALTDQEMCTAGLEKKVADMNLKAAVLGQMALVKQLTGNALALFHKFSCSNGGPCNARTNTIVIH